MGVSDVKQQETLTKLRSTISDCTLPKQSDDYLLQWLRARDFDLEKAELMIRKSLKWRETFGTDILTDDWKGPEVYNKYYPVGFSGYDKEKNPVWILPWGRLDVHGLLRCAQKEEFVRYTVWMFERSMRLMQEQSVNQHVFIFDMEGSSFLQFITPSVMEVISQLVKVQEANYPETLKKCIVVNASKFSAVIYGLIKPFLPEKTSKKVLIFDSNRETWKSALLDMIEPSQLPVNWGGTRTDPVDGNPYCSSQVSISVPTLFNSLRFNPFVTQKIKRIN